MAKELLRYRIVPGKHLPPSKHPSPNFGSFVVFEVLCVTAHHAKFLRSELKVTPLRSLWCASGSMTWRRFCTYPSIVLFAAFFPWVRNSRTASNDALEGWQWDTTVWQKRFTPSQLSWRHDILWKVFECTNLVFLVSAYRDTHMSAQCSYASVVLAQAHPNKQKTISAVS